MVKASAPFRGPCARGSVAGGNEGQSAEDVDGAGVADDDESDDEDVDDDSDDDEDVDAAVEELDPLLESVL